MIQKSRKWFATVACVAAILSIFASSASASPIDPHAYTEQDFTGTITGGYFSSTRVQDDLFSNWSSSNSGSFITKEMWVWFNGNEWIEVGDVDGSVNNSYWNGHYEAIQRYNSSTGKYVYSETTIGSPTPTGTHNYEISYAGSNAWNVYVDGSKVDFWTFYYPTAAGMNVGIESDDNANTFTSGTYASSVEYQNNTGWNYQQYPTNHDNNTLGWTSSFTYANGNNKIVYSHN